jgi:hypothetical protein
MTRVLLIVKGAFGQVDLDVGIQRLQLKKLEIVVIIPKI